ncbi:major capsid pentamer protein [Mycobacterium phage Thonko]|uniref:Uncharacterized protein n=1 Tax=Mycobacterium phage Thonko TaxID=2282910 RepID=A0A346FC61_9CAUD|nr:hypothetical protein I5G57_gp014 [Mycobacterium phage Thonko]AXN53286.1 major capsid pentamer protein [Mycobacterium phage Thonko]
MTAPVLAAVNFTAPRQNPAIPGLFAVTNWQPVGEAARHLNGVEIRGENYGGEGAAGVWEADWCAPPDPATVTERKEGERPDIADVFDPIVVWAFDQCDLTRPSQAEVRARAAQILRLEEQSLIEREFAERLKADVTEVFGTAETAANLKLAIGYIEGVLAQTNTLGYIHIGAQWVSQESGLFTKSGAKYVSPLGHTYVIGGGYTDGLDDLIVATSPTFGWRSEPAVREALDERHNQFVAVAERSVVIGYEAIVAAVQITA